MTFGSAVFIQFLFTETNGRENSPIYGFPWMDVATRPLEADASHFITRNMIFYVFYLRRITFHPFDVLFSPFSRVD